MRFFPENEGNFGGNQLPDGSIRLSPTLPKTNDLPRRSRNEPSPEIPLTLPFSGIFQGFSARYSYSNHSQDHGQWQVCMCVCACVVVYCVMLCAVLCYILKKYEENE